jgi:hypothetical protein
VGQAPQKVKQLSWEPFQPLAFQSRLQRGLLSSHVHRLAQRDLGRASEGGRGSSREACAQSGSLCSSPLAHLAGSQLLSCSLSRVLAKQMEVVALR